MRPIQERRASLLLVCVPLAHLLYVTITGRRHYGDAVILLSEAACLLFATLLLDSRFGPDGIGRGLVRTFLFSFSLVFFLGVPTAYDNERLLDADAARNFVLASLSVIPIVAASATGTWVLFRRIAVGKVQRKDLPTDPSRVLLGFCVGAGTIVFAWYVWQTRHAIPLIDTLRGANPIEAANLRHDALAGLRPASLAVFFQYARDFLLPIAAMLSLLEWLHDKRICLGIMAIVVSLIAALSAVLTLEKSPLVNLALMLGVTVVVAPNRPPRWILAAFTGISGAGVLFLTKLTNASDRTLGNLLEGLYRRIVLGPAEVASEYFAWAPKASNGFMHGAGLPVLHHFAARGSVDVPREVYKFMRPTEAVVGSANGAFHAMAWAEFGWIAVFVSAACVGVVLVGVGVLTLGARHHAIEIIIIGLTVVTILKSMSTSLTSSLLGIGFGYADTVAVLVLLYWFMSRSNQALRFATSEDVTQ